MQKRDKIVYERYFFHSPYTMILEMHLLELNWLDEKRFEAFFDRTIFRPAGGGQDPDRGYILSSNASARAELVNVKPMEKGICHTLKLVHGNFTACDRVTAFLDEKHRLGLMRAHTGEHIFARALQDLTGLKPKKVHIRPDEGDLIVNESGISWDVIKKAEESANNAVASSYPVRIRFYSSAIELQKRYSDKIRINIRNDTDIIRVIEIGDYDVSACTGTHLANTREVLAFKVTNYRRAGSEGIINFVTGFKAFKVTAKTYNAIWPVSQELTTGLGQLPTRIRKIRSMMQLQHQKIKQLEAVLLEIQAEALTCSIKKIGDAYFISKSVPYGDIKYGFKLIEHLTKKLEAQLGGAASWFFVIGLGDPITHLLLKSNLPRDTWEKHVRDLVQNKGKIGPDFAIIPMDGNISFKEFAGDIQNCIKKT
ncbi:MAG: hypothetical protein ACTSW4_01585 [Candidatus Ranarchaeia archaeon]